MKVYHRGQVVKVHPRQPAGGQTSDAGDFPPGTDVYARRDVDRLARMAAAHGKAIGLYAHRILDTDLPWTKMRAVYALIGLARTCQAQQVKCTTSRAGSRRGRYSRAPASFTAAPNHLRRENPGQNPDRNPVRQPSVRQQPSEPSCATI